MPYRLVYCTNLIKKEGVTEIIHSNNPVMFCFEELVFDV